MGFGPGIVNIFREMMDLNPIDMNPIEMNVDLKKLTRHIAQENSLTRDYKALKKEINPQYLISFDNKRKK